ncbi:MAG: hypothetical protein N7Q72_07725, partial [Spiroplasma sp. Tabriz.8]|nr:hypothetical protein [Spiroplasma sp. Tabriz.8]
YNINEISFIYLLLLFCSLFMFLTFFFLSFFCFFFFFFVLHILWENQGWKLADGGPRFLCYDMEFFWSG